MHKAHLIIDLQFGSTGKGLLAGYLAKRENYDSVVCSFATNAGHTYIDKSRGIFIMTQQLPTGITSPTVKNVFIGPGALIHAATLREEIRKYQHFLHGKRLIIHSVAAVVEDYHADNERVLGMTKIGSTTKGVGAAAVERIWRDPDDPNIAGVRFRGTDLEQYVASGVEYDELMNKSESILIEGAQGFSLSMYHGYYPFCTSRDVTPWQIAADCGVPYKWAPYIQVMGTLRTLPIRVNNRDGTSGPPYPDQMELDWGSVGVDPEKTTVTKLNRRIFTFSHRQLEAALYHCGGYWTTKLFLNFANYIQPDELQRLIQSIETPTPFKLNPPTVAWIGNGPSDSDIQARDTMTGDIHASDTEGGDHA